MQILIKFDDNKKFKNREKFKKMILESLLFAKKVKRDIISDPEYLSVILTNDEFRQNVCQKKHKLIEQIDMSGYITNSELNQNGVEMLMEYLEMDDDIHARTLFLETILVTRHELIFKPIIMRLIQEGIDCNFIMRRCIYYNFLNRICSMCDIDIVKAYIDRYPESIEKCTKRNNPVYASIQNENLEITRYLLTFECIKNNFSSYELDTNINGSKNQNQILKILMYEFPDVELTGSDPIGKLSNLEAFLKIFLKNPNESAFDNFDELFKRCNYDLQHADINFFKIILKLYNPHLLQFILDNTNIDLNGGKKKTDLLANLNYYHYDFYHYNNQYNDNYFKCMKILLRSGRYNVTFNDIKSCNVFDKELFDLLNSLCITNMMCLALKYNYNKYREDYLVIGEDDIDKQESDNQDSD